jgi:hypothetical protein
MPATFQYVPSGGSKGPAESAHELSRQLWDTETYVHPSEISVSLMSAIRSPWGATKDPLM